MSVCLFGCKFRRFIFFAHIKFHCCFPFLCCLFVFMQCVVICCVAVCLIFSPPPYSCCLAPKEVYVLFLRHRFFPPDLFSLETHIIILMKDLAISYVFVFVCVGCVILCCVVIFLVFSICRISACRRLLLRLFVWGIHQFLCCRVGVGAGVVVFLVFCICCISDCLARNEVRRFFFSFSLSHPILPFRCSPFLAFLCLRYPTCVFFVCCSILCIVIIILFLFGHSYQLVLLSILAHKLSCWWFSLIYAVHFC